MHTPHRGIRQEPPPTAPVRAQLGAFIAYVKISSSPKLLMNGVLNHALRSRLTSMFFSSIPGNSAVMRTALSVSLTSIAGAVVRVSSARPGTASKNERWTNELVKVTITGRWKDCAETIIAYGKDKAGNLIAQTGGVDRWFAKTRRPLHGQGSPMTPALRFGRRLKQAAWSREADKSHCLWDYTFPLRVAQLPPPGPPIPDLCKQARGETGGRVLLLTHVL